MGRNSGGILINNRKMSISDILKNPDDGHVIKSSDISSDEINKFKIKNEYDIQQSSFNNHVYKVSRTSYEHELNDHLGNMPILSKYKNKEKYLKDSIEFDKTASKLSKQTALKYVKDYNSVKNKSMKILISRTIKEHIENSKKWIDNIDWLKKTFSNK